jgi:hypothetical protein
MGSAPAVSDVARLASIDAPAFSIGGELKSRSPAPQPAKTTVPHKAANAASRRGFITSSLSVWCEASPNRCCTPRHKTACFSDKNQGIGENMTKQGRKLQAIIFSEMCCGMPLDPGITVNYRADASINIWNCSGISVLHYEHERAPAMG